MHGRWYSEIVFVVVGWSVALSNGKAGRLHAKIQFGPKHHNQSYSLLSTRLVFYYGMR